MKTIFTIVTATTLLLTTPAVASVDAAQCEDTINVKVNGLVCDFCARALEKVFGKRDEVAGIKVDLDNSHVAVLIKPGQTMDDETLTELITDSGYNVTDINQGC